MKKAEKSLESLRNSLFDSFIESSLAPWYQLLSYFDTSVENRTKAIEAREEKVLQEAKALLAEVQGKVGDTSETLPRPAEAPETNVESLPLISSRNG